VPFSIGQFNTYHPFPDSNAYWLEDELHQQYPDIDNLYFNYFLKGDTTLFGNIYHKVFESGGEITQEIVNPYSYSQRFYNQLSYAGAIREDSLKHIFLYWSSSPLHDTLLYDFNLQVGDTLPPYLSGGYNVNIITSIDSILIGKTYRKRCNTYWCSIIEGIGSTQGLLEIIGAPNMDGPQGSSSIQCFLQNDTTFYSPYYDTCIPYNGTTVVYSVPKIVQQSGSFSIYPNPSAGTLSINYTVNAENQKGILNLYNLLGQAIKSTAVTGNNGVMTENISSLTNGIYYYTLSIGEKLVAVQKVVLIKP
jgi:hypothetical protein